MYHSYDIAVTSNNERPTCLLHERVTRKHYRGPGVAASQHLWFVAFYRCSHMAAFGDYGTRISVRKRHSTLPYYLAAAGLQYHTFPCMATRTLCGSSSS